MLSLVCYETPRLTCCGVKSNMSLRSPCAVTVQSFSGSEFFQGFFESVVSPYMRFCKALSSCSVKCGGAAARAAARAREPRALQQRVRGGARAARAAG